MKWVDPSIELVACGSSSSDDAHLRLAGSARCWRSATTTWITSPCTATTAIPPTTRRTSWPASMDMDSFIKTVVCHLRQRRRARSTARRRSTSASTSGTYGTTPTQQDNDSLTSRNPGARAPAPAGGRLQLRGRAAGGQHAHHPPAQRRPGEDCLPGAAGQRHRADHDRATAAASWAQTIFWPFMHASNYGRGTALRALGRTARCYDCADYHDVPYRRRGGDAGRRRLRHALLPSTAI